MRYVNQVLSIEQVFNYNSKTNSDDGRANWLGAINEVLVRLKGAKIIHISQGGEYTGAPVAIIEYQAVDMQVIANPKGEMRIGMNVVSHVHRRVLGVHPGDVGIVLGFDELPIGKVAIIQFRTRSHAEFRLACCAMLDHEYDLTGDDAIAYAKEQEIQAFANEIGPVGYAEPAF